MLNNNFVKNPIELRSLKINKYNASMFSIIFISLIVIFNLFPTNQGHRLAHSYSKRIQPYK